jgi:hypothetical protein
MFSGHKSWFALLLVLALAGAGCDKKDKESGTEPGPAGKPAGAKHDTSAAGGPFAGFDLDAAKSKLEGTWVLGGSVLGRKEAWQVNGSEVTVYDGKSEKKYQMSLVAPCYGKLTREEGGGTTSTYFTFAFDGDTLYKGLGQAGIKKGDSVVACISGEIFTLQGGTCQKWKESMFGDKLKSSEAECSLEGDVFKAKTRTGESELKLKGAVLLNQQMEKNQAIKTADFAEAKSKVDAE